MALVFLSFVLIIVIRVEDIIMVNMFGSGVFFSCLLVLYST